MRSNSSIERTATGKPVSAAHVERYQERRFLAEPGHSCCWSDEWLLS